MQRVAVPLALLLVVAVAVVVVVAVDDRRSLRRLRQVVRVLVPGVRLEAAGDGA